jgi:hypothetical protein
MSPPLAKNFATENLCRQRKVKEMFKIVEAKK